MSDKPEIFIPSADEWKGFAHGQMVLDRPGLFINFAATHEEINAGVWARKLADYLAGNEPFFEFREPHFGQQAFLTRAGAEKVTLIQCAKSAKIMPEARHGTRLLDSETRKPIEKADFRDLSRIVRE